LSSTEPAIGNVAVVEPPLVIHNTQPQDPQPPKSPLHTPPGDLDLPLYPALNSKREVRRVFQEEEDEAWAAHISEYTMQGNLFALLQAKNESITWKSYM
jgi:hypothetical protein